MKILFIVLIASLAAVQGLNCKPGQVFHDKCNICKCLNDGSDAACTKMACPPGRYNSNGKLISLQQDETSRSNNLGEGLVCTPGSIFKENCNTCVCGKNGRAAVCTMKACPQLKNSVNELICEPGTTFRDDCNTCICSKDGRAAACTKLLCPRIG